jgi:hypothetical protein
MSFKKNVIRYIFQNKEAINVAQKINREYFESTELMALFDIYLVYTENYKSAPEYKNIEHFIGNFKNLNEAAKKKLQASLSWVYDKIEDVEFIKQSLLEEVKVTLFNQLLVDALDADELNQDYISSVHKKLMNINELDITFVNSGGLLLRDIDKYMYEEKQAHPTFLRSLNTMTTKGGFGPPETIIFMKPPKAFGTGMLVKFCTEYMKDGLNCFYADFENGEMDMRIRFKQALLECKISEIRSFNSELKQIVDKLLTRTGAGDVFIKKYAKRKDHVLNVELDIDKLDFKPDFFVWDYIDIMGNPLKGKDKREGIQQNYAEVDRINNELKAFSFTVSKMKSEAINKEWPGPEDIAEDFEKIYNSHATFAIMRNEEDIVNNMGRIIPIVQRMGVSYEKIACYINIDIENYIINEVDLDE